MGKSLITTSTAMILGALTGGTILGALGGKELNPVIAGAITGGASAVVANTLSLLIKTDNNITGCLKTTISIPISATFTLFALAYIMEYIMDAKTSSNARVLTYMLFGAINAIAATVGVVGAATINYFHNKPPLTQNPNWLLMTENSSDYKVNNEESKEIDVNKLKLN